jgi:hypothetical protein
MEVAPSSEILLLLKSKDLTPLDAKAKASAPASPTLQLERSKSFRTTPLLLRDRTAAAKAAVPASPMASLPHK